MAASGTDALAATGRPRATSNSGARRSRTTGGGTPASLGGSGAKDGASCGYGSARWSRTRRSPESHELSRNAERATRAAGSAGADGGGVESSIHGYRRRPDHNPASGTQRREQVGRRPRDSAGLSRPEAAGPTLHAEGTRRPYAPTDRAGE